MNDLYTIGHSQHPIQKFIGLLKQHNIEFVVDVRSTPYSKYASMYDRENISNELKNANISYAFMGKYFGARQDDKSLYTKEGYLDFQKVAKWDIFEKGMDNVVRGMETKRIALMCLEKKPIDCHRAILVANAFYCKGYSVKHILENGKIETHQELNEELLDLYFPDRNQISFFDNRTDEDYLEDAYKIRNKEIGYHLEER
ncbi:MAG TPA: DUF488 domain-containing protein [Lachnospiraceae bacterium]|jgi:uncharacterized protein (DUF488 family)|nr:DUF488 domain-containing protein [Lachnospiraceae bacterium]